MLHSAQASGQGRVPRPIHQKQARYCGLAEQESAQDGPLERHLLRFAQASEQGRVPRPIHQNQVLNQSEPARHFVQDESHPESSTLSFVLVSGECEVRLLLRWVRRSPTNTVAQKLKKLPWADIPLLIRRRASLCLCLKHCFGFLEIPLLLRFLR